MRHSTIVVGIDGSAGSTKALRWAAGEARRRDVRLRIITVYAYTWSPEAFGGLAEQPDYAKPWFTEVVNSAVAEARAMAPGVEVTGAAMLGEPAQTLLDAGRDADVVVVGNRGRGGFASLLLGSVSQQVATHATGTVVVVRGRADTPDGPIVVGVDDSPSAGRALQLAFEQARRCGCGLQTVRACPLPIPSACCLTCRVRRCDPG